MQCISSGVLLTVVIFNSIHYSVGVDSNEIDSNEISSIENEIDYDFSDENYYIKNDHGTLEIDPSVDEDAKLDTVGLIKKYGYEVERHYVTTEDGYIVQLHRLIGGPLSPPRHGKKIVFVMHGLLDSSAGFILTGPNQALGYILADNDYDVWLGNARGTIYSTNHTFLNPFGSRASRKKFWSFSWHEIGLYDMPACIDYILEKTLQTKLQYIGHSQGSTAFFVMISERPEYNEKIELMHALAPATILSHTSSPLIRVFVPFLPIIEKFKALAGIHYFTPSKKFRVLAGELLCKDNTPTQIICENVIFLLMGYDSDQLNKTLIPVILGHAPAGCATNQLIHYGQIINSRRFRKFDYGRIRNFFIYRRFSPPDYNLKNVRAPVAIYHSQNDWLVTPKDVHTFMQMLPNIVKSYLVPHKQFNHVDFIWGTDAPILLYNELLQTMKSSYSALESFSDENRISNSVQLIT